LKNALEKCVVERMPRTEEYLSFSRRQKVERPGGEFIFLNPHSRTVGKGLFLLGHIPFSLQAGPQRSGPDIK